MKSFVKMFALASVLLLSACMGGSWEKVGLPDPPLGKTWVCKGSYDPQTKSLSDCHLVSRGAVPVYGGLNVWGGSGNAACIQMWSVTGQRLC